MADGSREAPLCLPPRPPARPPRPTLPPGTCDCHFHVFAEGAPLADRRSYTPRPASLEGWLGLAGTAGIARGVAVQPSVYGFDNTVLLAALAVRPDMLRGIVVISPDTPRTEVERLHRLGVRGVRLNLRNKSGLGLDAAPGLARLIRPFGWHLQFQIGPEQIAQVAEIAAKARTTAVIDHMAFLPPQPDAVASGLPALQRLLDGGAAYVKLSAPYRLAPPQHYPELGEPVRHLARSHPERLLWGSDWPHPELFADMPDDAELVEATLSWLPGAALRRQIFIDNPQALYWST
jgi:predicted TIM-barrel fold metal-dependent hydrolase